MRTVAQSLILQCPPRVRWGARPLKSHVSISFLITWPNKLELRRMILDIGADSRAVLDFFDFLPGGAVLSRLLKSPNRFRAYTSHAIELKLGRVILDISPYNRSEPDFSISFQGGRLLKTLNRFTSHSIHPIELELDRMIVNICSLNRSKLDSSISFQGALWGRVSCNLQIGSQTIVLMQLS